MEWNKQNKDDSIVSGWVIVQAIRFKWRPDSQTAELSVNRATVRPQQLLVHFVFVSSKQQEASESIKVMFLRTDGTIFGHNNLHRVPSVQFHRHNNSGTVFKVLVFGFDDWSRHSVVHHQIGAGVTDFTGVDGEGEAVNATAGGGEDTGLIIVALTQVKGDIFVDDGFVGTGGAKAGLAVESDREGAAAGCKYREGEIITLQE